MTIHIGACATKVADTVLLPGDPHRARWAATAFLDNPEKYCDIRGMLGFTGTWKGHRVSIQGTGMGMPSLSIYVNELIKTYDTKTLIRVGSCGGMQSYVDLHDIIIAMTASSMHTPSTEFFGGLSFAPTANWELLRKAAECCKAKQKKHHIGGIYSTDTFYSERADLNEQMIRHGILGVEMETAELYTIALRHNRHALAILTVSDHLNTGAELSSIDRETGFTDMIEIALETAFR
ncbi:MAG: purine-nucleoside phosphorylase [Aestuariivita sp.]|nr:purine-nucleoside phosphorylase [Aestuariivita sp.]